MGAIREARLFYKTHSDGIHRPACCHARLAAFEGMREGSLYLSTGGGWSPATEAAVRVLAARPGAQLVAATDANAQGEAFAVRLTEREGRTNSRFFGCNLYPTCDYTEPLGRPSCK